MNDFNESQVKRDWHGRFTHDLVGKWAVEASRRFNDRGLKRGDDRPPGFEAAIARSQELWNVPDRRRGIERTDDQQAELEELEAAFETYRARLGATERDPRSNNLQFLDQIGRKFDAYGRIVGNFFLLDGSGRQERRQTINVKGERRSRRSEDWSGIPDDRERRPASEGGKIGRRLEGAPEVFVKEMRRAQARARVEGSSRTPRRRTPRGTQVDSWMDKVSKGIGRGASGG